MYRKGLGCLAIIAIFLVVALTTSGFAQPTPSSAGPKGQVKIGALLPFTGTLLESGPYVDKGAKVALDEAGWQVAGRKIEYILEDDATSATVSLDKARKLVERDKVSFILSPLDEGIQASLAPYVEKNKTLLIGNRTMGPEAVEKHKYVFAPSGVSTQYAYSMGAYAYDKLGYRTVTMINIDNLCGRFLVAAFKKSFEEERGGKVVQAQYHPPPAVDFSPYITALKISDACVMWNPTPGRLRFVSLYEELGYFKKMPLLASLMGGTFEERDLYQYGDKCIGVIGAYDWGRGVNTPLNKKFVEAYRKKYGEYGRGTAYGGYKSIQLILETIKATGGDTTPEKLQQAMSKIKMETPTGFLSFTPGGTGIINIYIAKCVKADAEYKWDILEVYPEVRPPEVKLGK